jgi:hypothetical protein
MTLSKLKSHGFAVTLLNIVPGNAKLPNVVLPNVAVLNVVSPEKKIKKSSIFFFCSDGLERKGQVTDVEILRQNGRRRRGQNNRECKYTFKFWAAEQGRQN